MYTVQDLVKLLQTIPKNVKKPRVEVDEDGDMFFDWNYPRNLKYVSLWFKSDGSAPILTYIPDTEPVDTVDLTMLPEVLMKAFNKQS